MPTLSSLLNSRDVVLRCMTHPRDSYVSMRGHYSLDFYSDNFCVGLVRTPSKTIVLDESEFLRQYRGIKWKVAKRP